MESEVDNRLRICPVPPGSKMGLNWRLKPRTIMTISLVFILTTTSLMYYLMRPPPTPPAPLPLPPSPDPGTPHDAITIDGDANFSARALLEGWPGDGSPGNPYIIDGLDIDLGGGFGHCIYINNTRVSFIVRNCNLSGAGGPTWFPEDAGICLENVTNSELINNICNNNSYGILLQNSIYNTVANNTCTNNYQGITLGSSNSNTVTNNTCNSNGREESPYKMGEGISLYFGSDSNTVTHNTCNGNDQGIVLNVADFNILAKNTCNYNNVTGIELEYEANSNTLANNTCNSNDIGIYIEESSNNTVTRNTCNSNDIGIFLSVRDSQQNTMENNICNNNRIDIYILYILEVPSDDAPIYETEEFDPVGFVLVGFAGIIMLGAGWRMVKLSRIASRTEEGGENR